MDLQPFQALWVLLHGQARQAGGGLHGSFGKWGGVLRQLRRQAGSALSLVLVVWLSPS